MAIVPQQATLQPLRGENLDGVQQQQPLRNENLGATRPLQPLSRVEDLGVPRPLQAPSRAEDFGAVQRPLSRVEDLGALRSLQPLSRAESLGVPRPLQPPSRGENLGATRLPLALRGDTLGAARRSRDSRLPRSHGLYDDNALRKEILDTHQLVDEPGIASRSVLQVIEVIFSNATADLPHITDLQQGTLLPQVATIDEKAVAVHASLMEMIELPTKVTSTIFCEILVKWLNAGDEHKTAIQILQTLRHYDWDEKVVLAVAAFAVTYGEFRLASQLYPSNTLAKAIALLKQYPEILDHQIHHGAWKTKFEAISNLIKAMLDVTKSILSYYDLPHKEYFTTETPEIMAILAHIPLAVYWTIRSVIVCSTQILGISGIGLEGISEAWDLSSLAHKLNSMRSHIDDLLRSLYRIIDKRRDDESFDLLARILETSHIDNSKSLRILFSSKDDLPLYDCFHKRKASIDDLRKKIVVLFITDLEIPQVEYAIVGQMYHERRENPTRTESQYEVIWLPVTDMWTDEKLRRFHAIREDMLWYSIDHPSVVPPVAIRYFRERCNFHKKPILLVLDTSGKKVHDNAMHMMCIWGSLAYPFSFNKERLLWDEETWRLELLSDAIDPQLIAWLQEGRHICLYGGEDIDWIRKFTRTAKEAARDSGIPLGMLYVGKNKAKEKISRNIVNIIEKEGLSNAVEWNMIWYFWERIESMWHSKGQHSIGKNVKDDPIMLGIIAMLSYGSSEQGWALIGRGVHLVYSNGEVMHKSLDEHPEWKPREMQVGFLTALEEYLRKVHRDIPHHCTSLILPSATKEIPDTVACSECGRLMDRYTMFRCCTD